MADEGRRDQHLAARQTQAIPREKPVSKPLSTRRLGRSFFARPATEVAPELLGRVLVRTLPGGHRMAARIVEAEAYEENDPCSHAFGGRQTPRNEVMFGRPGLLYVYFTYGMHFCSNVVTWSEERGSAVLLRAAEPLDGLRAMERRRGTHDIRNLCSGPAKLTQAFDFGRRQNGVDLAAVSSAIRIEYGRPIDERSIGRTPRIGVGDGPGSKRAWRFVAKGNPFASRRS
jgi:DNA-3-methyladenine glycosylase